MAPIDTAAHAQKAYVQRAGVWDLNIEEIRTLLAFGPWTRILVFI